MKRKVVCSICGKKGNVEVGKKGKIANTSWNFFGRFALNTPASRELYSMANQSESEKEFENQETDKAMQISKALVEYWECKDCAQDIESVQKKRF